MGFHLMQPRFPLGRIFATPGVLDLNVDLAAYRHRHHCGDWGDELCAEDSLRHGTRLLSRFSTPGGSIYIII